MFNLTFHRLIYILVFGIVYATIHTYWNLEINSLTIGTFIGLFGSLIWDWLFLKQPEFKDKYRE